MDLTDRFNADRFWSNVRRGDGCWEWTRALDRKGYGKVGSGPHRRHSLFAHRVSYALTYGEIPAGLWVLHHCDNPRCVRPDHLFLGTAADNTRDMMAKGRGRYNAAATTGERNGRAKITSEDVRAIRESYAAGGTSLSRLAASFGITKAQVHAIVQRRSWKTADAHVPAGQRAA